MWDTRTLKTIKTIDVQGGPDAILFDEFNEHVYIFSHTAPHATVINAVDGAVLGTIDLGGMPEQAVTDGSGHIYVDIRDKDNVAVIDAKTMTASAHYDLGGKGGRCSGLAIDVKNHVLFAACREPQTMVMMNSGDGKIISALPIGSGVDSAIFNPKTMETYSAQVDGTLTIVKEKSPTSFVVEQTVQTKPSAKQMVWDTKTNRILLVAADYEPAPASAATGSGGARLELPRPEDRCCRIRFQYWWSASSARPSGRRVVSSRQLRPRSATSREASVKAMRPTAAKGVAKMAPVERPGIEHAAGDEGKRDCIRANHPSAMPGDLPVTRSDEGGGRADDPGPGLHGGSWHAGAAGGEGEPGRGADKDGDDVDAAEDAVELQVTPAKTQRELHRAGQESDNAAECMGDEEMAVGDDLQTVGVVHRVIGDEKNF